MVWLLGFYPDTLPLVAFTFTQRIQTCYVCSIWHPVCISKSWSRSAKEMYGNVATTLPFVWSILVCQLENPLGIQQLWGKNWYGLSIAVSCYHALQAAPPKSIKVACTSAPSEHCRRASPQKVLALASRPSKKGQKNEKWINVITLSFWKSGASGTDFLFSLWVSDCHPRGAQPGSEAKSWGALAFASCDPLCTEQRQVAKQWSLAKELIGMQNAVQNRHNLCHKLQPGRSAVSRMKSKNEGPAKKTTWYEPVLVLKSYVVLSCLVT